MTQTEKIQAACTNYNDLSTQADNARELGTRTAEQLAAVHAAKTELIALLDSLGFTSTSFDAERRPLRNGAKGWEAKRHGHVKMTDSGSVPSHAYFTPRVKVEASAKHEAARRRFDSQERHY